MNDIHNVTQGEGLLVFQGLCHHDRSLLIHILLVTHWSTNKLIIYFKLLNFSLSLMLCCCHVSVLHICEFVYIIEYFCFDKLVLWFFLWFLRFFKLCFEDSFLGLWCFVVDTFLNIETVYYVLESLHWTSGNSHTV